MAETVSAVVGEILAQGSFDLSQAEALAILNRRHKQMCARSRCVRSATSATRIGAAGASATYAAPAGLMDMMQMLVASGTSFAEYRKAKRADVEAMYEGTLPISGTGGVFVEYSDTAHPIQWLLYPDPTVSNGVVVFGTFEPPDLLINNTVPFAVDADMIEGLMAGVFATALNRPGEARPDLAAQQEQVFSAACEELRARVARRNRGGGPAQIRLSGLLAS
jgi:hypothetical protein